MSRRVFLIQINTKFLDYFLKPIDTYYVSRPHVIYLFKLFFFNCPLFFAVSTLLSAKVLSTLYYIKNVRSNIHFNYNFLLISPFYWVRHINLRRYGLKGTSNTMGLGNHSLNNYWFYNLISQYLFYKTGYFFYIISSSILILILYYILYLSSFNLFILLGLLLLFVSSKIFYKFTFVCQNYNALSWAFCPLFFYALQINDVISASLSLFIVSCLSFTATVLTIPFSLCFCLESNSFLPLLTIVPASIKILATLMYSAGFKNSLNSISTIAKAIGFTNRNTKYILKRDTFKRKYILYFYILFQIYIFYQTESINYFFFLFSFLVITNYFIARFCDEQSLDILSFIVLFHFALNQSHLDLFNIVFIVLLLNFSFVQIYDHNLIKRPLSAQPFINAFENFFKPINDNSKVFFCFSDPKNKYEDLFDRQRYLLDFPSYCATLRNIHLFPDYSTVLDTNYPDSPHIWANTPLETQILLKEYDTQYCIVSQNTESDLSNKWLMAGYSIVTTFDWGLFLNKNKINRDLWWFGMPKWFLLKLS